MVANAIHQKSLASSNLYKRISPMELGLTIFATALAVWLLTSKDTRKSIGNTVAEGVS